MPEKKRRGGDKSRSRLFFFFAFSPLNQRQRDARALSIDRDSHQLGRDFREQGGIDGSRKGHFYFLVETSFPRTQLLLICPIGAENPTKTQGQRGGSPNAHSRGRSGSRKGPPPLVILQHHAPRETPGQTQLPARETGAGRAGPLTLRPTSSPRERGEFCCPDDKPTKGMCVCECVCVFRVERLERLQKEDVAFLCSCLPRDVSKGHPNWRNQRLRPWAPGNSITRGETRRDFLQGGSRMGRLSIHTMTREGATDRAKGVDRKSVV